MVEISISSENSMNDIFGSMNNMNDMIYCNASNAPGRLLIFQAFEWALIRGGAYTISSIVQVIHKSKI